jgi:hypothetical protein
MMDSAGNCEVRPVKPHRLALSAAALALAGCVTATAQYHTDAVARCSAAGHQLQTDSHSACVAQTATSLRERRQREASQRIRAGADVTRPPLPPASGPTPQLQLICESAARDGPVLCH